MKKINTDTESLLNYGADFIGEVKKIFGFEEKKPTKEILREFYVRHPFLVGFCVSFMVSHMMDRFSKYLKKRVKKNTILELDLSNATLVEVPPKPTLLSFLDRDVSATIWYHDIVDSLEQAASDCRVKGLICNLGNGSCIEKLGLGHIQELSNAILKFREGKAKEAQATESGKNNKYFTFVFAETLGLGSNGTKSYYFASAFDRIYMAPLGMVAIPGFYSMATFYRGTFDKIGAEVLIEQREEFKTFANSYKETKFTESHKKQLNDLVEDILKHTSDTIRTRRLFSLDRPDAINDILNAALFPSDKALSQKLIDSVSYIDEAYLDAYKSLGFEDKSHANLLFVQRYLEKVERKYTPSKKSWNPFKKSHTIAIIFASGPILDGEKPADLFNSEEMIYSYTLGRAIRNAANDKSVKAIILRVDSPGGSAVASDYIRREIVRAKTEHKKKVIVSMGNVAASGGYWISAEADKIVCNGLTFTGSIGVISGKINFKDTFGKLGITFDHVQSNENSTIFSPVHSYNDNEKNISKDAIDFYYGRFIDLVRQTRGGKMKTENIRDKAKGKVYTGTQALEEGLVDEIGDLSKAIEVARELIGAEESDHLLVKEYPQKKGLLELLSQQKPDNSDQLPSAQFNSSIPTMMASTFARNQFATISQSLPFVGKFLSQLSPLSNFVKFSSPNSSILPKHLDTSLPTNANIDPLAYMSFWN